MMERTKTLKTRDKLPEMTMIVARIKYLKRRTMRRVIETMGSDRCWCKLK
jgi:hypothetical protein